MTVVVNDPRATNLGMRSGEKETVKSDIVVPQTAEEKPLLALDVNADDRISTRIKIDAEGHLIISEEEHLATLSGIARVASGSKPILESKVSHREGAFHWQDKL